MGYVKRNVTSWGGNAIRGDDDKWHMFVSEIPDGCSLNYWNPNSQVIHATADSPAGPYHSASVAGLAAHDPPKLNPRQSMGISGHTSPADDPASESYGSGLLSSGAKKMTDSGISIISAVNTKARHRDMPHALKA